ncbi:MAG: MFS transporter [Firmicutes bacterium]|nr:MFS transporter [Bacillota bacterium]
MDNTVKKNQSSPKEVTSKREKLNITLFMSGKIASLLGTFIYDFAISLYILKLTGSGTSFSISILLGMLPRVILSPIAGSVADKRDRKKMIVGLDALSGITVLSLLAVSHIFGLKIIFIYITTFTLGIINTFFDVSMQASIPNLVSDKNLVKINSYAQASTSLAAILGPVLGGVIYGLIPMKIFLLINGFSFIVSSITEGFIDFKFNKNKIEYNEANDDKGFKAIIKHIAEVVSFIRDQNALYTIMKFALIFNLLVNSTLAVILPYIINNTLKMTSTQFGIIEGSFSIGVLASSIIVSKLPEKKSNLKSLIIGTIMMGVMLSLIGIPAIETLQSINNNIIFIYYIFVLFMFSVFMIIVNIPIQVNIQRMTPDKMMGRVMGVISTLSNGIVPLGILVSGVLVDVVKPAIIPIASGIVSIGVAFILSKSKSLKDY